MIYGETWVSKELNIQGKLILKEWSLKNLPRKEQFLSLLNKPVIHNS